MAIIYSLIDPLTAETYYIGITLDIDTRYYQHLHSVILPTTVKLLSTGYKPTLKILEQGDHVTLELERKYIKQFIKDGEPLENKDGVINYQAWSSDTNLTDNEIIYLRTLSIEDRYKTILERVLNELPNRSTIPVVIKIKNFINTVLTM